MKMNRTILIATLLGVMCLWVGDTAIDSFHHKDTPFLKLLFNVNIIELSIRLFNSVCLLVFGVFFAHMSWRKDQIVSKLEAFKQLSGEYDA